MVHHNRTKMEKHFEPEPNSNVTATVNVTVTVDLVERVTKRLEEGLSLKIALFGEGVSVAALEEYLKDHPELAALHETARRKFMEFAVKKLLEEEKPAASIRWLLEHCHPDLLAQPVDAGSAGAGAATGTATAQETIAGVPNHILERMQELAKNPHEHYEH